MLDAHSVITEATKPCVEDLARDYEISLGRMYKILGPNNPYPKSKVLIRRVAARNKDGYELIKADMLALFAELDGLDTNEVSDAEMSQELHDPLQARLEHRPKAERLSECRQAIVVLAKEIAEIEREGKPPVRFEMKAAVESRRNGHK